MKQRFSFVIPHILLLGLIFLTPPALSAYELTTLNLEVPTGLEEAEGEFILQHRFQGEFFEDIGDTFWGMTSGVNVGLGLRYQVWKQIELNLSYGTDWREVVAGASYAHMVPQIFLRSQLDLQFFSYKPYGSDDRENNFFGQLALQSEPIAKRVSPVLNLGYDNENQKAGLGLGLNVIVFRKLELVGEYYPVLDRDEDLQFSENCFAFGIKWNTPGHHFMLMLGNGQDFTTRRLMRGTRDRNLYFGFNINRIHEF